MKEVLEFICSSLERYIKILALVIGACAFFKPIQIINNTTIETPKEEKPADESTH